MRLERTARGALALALLVLGALACAPAAPNPTAARPGAAPPAGTAGALPAAASSAGAASPALPGTASPAAPGAASSAVQGAAGSAATAGAAAADWQVEWDQTVAAARQEGTLVVSAPVGDVWRNALLAFQQAYPDVALELTGFNSRDFWPRVAQERQAGQYLWDLRVGGPDTTVFGAIKDGALAPIRPLIIRPDVLDDSKWLQGFDALFADNAGVYLPAFMAYVSSPGVVNREFVAAADLRSDADLLDPKWRGKISLQNPQAGAGLVQLSVLLAAYGEDYLRDLLGKQELAVTDDSRQQAEWLVRGRYPIALGQASAQLLRFQEQGLGRQVEPLGGKYQTLSIGVGALQLLDRAPHPNAAKLFINWILTAPAQERLAKETELNSRRLDVAPGDPSQLPDPARLDQYVPSQAEKHAPVLEQTLAIVREMIH
ncbi:MAG TPA: extracellular solute-binding protein [Chloroflexota bacterium]|jgi:iron(III) transport system substrate-binding protein